MVDGSITTPVLPPARSVNIDKRLDHYQGVAILIENDRTLPDSFISFCLRTRRALQLRPLPWSRYSRLGQCAQVRGLDFSFDVALSIGVGGIQRNFGPMRQQVEHWRSQQRCSDAQRRQNSRSMGHLSTAIWSAPKYLAWRARYPGPSQDFRPLALAAAKCIESSGNQNPQFIFYPECVYRCLFIGFVLRAVKSKVLAVTAP
jgi:hypothetical protein